MLLRMLVPTSTVSSYKDPEEISECYKEPVFPQNTTVIFKPRDTLNLYSSDKYLSPIHHLPRMGTVNKMPCQPQ